MTQHGGGSPTQGLPPNLKPPLYSLAAATWTFAILLAADVWWVGGWG